MPKYDYKAKIMPAWLFGIPYKDNIILPEGVDYQKSWMATAMVPTEHETLPIYRKEEEKIKLKFKINDVNIEFSDNFVSLLFDADDYQSSYDKAITVLDDLAYTLSFMTGNKCRFELLFANESDEKNQWQTRATFGMVDFKLKIYGLEWMSKQITDTISFMDVLDDRLRKSLEYYNHALFLNRIRVENTIEEPEQGVYLLADIILYLNKSVSVIIGEPSYPDFITNIAKYGMDIEDWNKKIKNLWKIRNNYDVAHHRYSKQEIDKIATVTKDAYDTTKHVIRKYGEWVNNQKNNNLQDRIFSIDPRSPN